MTQTETLPRFIYRQERKYEATSGELSDLLSAISLGVKIIGKLVATAGFQGLYGYTGKTNVQGEQTQILDEAADRILQEVLGSSGHFGLLVSEEQDSVMEVAKQTELGHGEKYVVAFDPLDGSSNLGSNIPVGTIFTIFRKKELRRAACKEDFLQRGRNIVAAGYAVYGAKTSFVYSCGDGVHGFTLDPAIGEFILTDQNIRTPARGSIYSTNEGNYNRWDQRTRNFVDRLKSQDKEGGFPYSGRYVGSLVADFDRNLKKGGVFLYPADNKNPRGKLRLLYECMPLSFIAEHAGGRAFDGQIDVLDLVPTDIHERCPLIIGSRHEVEMYEKAR